MSKLVRDHKATLILLVISVVFFVLTLVTGYHYWKVEGPKAHGSFWNWFVHHNLVEMFGEAFVGGLIILWVTKAREKGSAETDDKH